MLEVTEKYVFITDYEWKLPPNVYICTLIYSYCIDYSRLNAIFWLVTEIKNKK